MYDVVKQLTLARWKLWILKKIAIEKLVQTSIHKRGELDKNDKNVSNVGSGARPSDRPAKQSRST